MKMFNSKNLIMMFLIVTFLVAIPIMASEIGTAKFAVTRQLFVGGNEIQIGRYDVTWESSNQDAAVTFTGIGKPVVIKVQGKIEEVAKKFDYNSIVIGKDSAGREAIKQLQFSGKNMRIVFE